MKPPVILLSMNVAPVGGLTNDVLKCVRALRSEGREVHVIYGFRGEGTLEAVADPEVHWHRIHMLKRPPVIGQIMLWWLASRTIRKIKQRAHDAITICFERLPIGEATIGSAPHALWMEVRKKMGLSPFSKIPYNIWCNWIDRSIQQHPTRKIVVFSERDRQALLERGVPEQRAERVVMPTDTNRFKPQQSVSRKFITIIGANPRLKGVDLVLKVWPQIRQSHPELTLRIVTQGWKVRQLVEQQSLEGVEIAPFITDVESYYASSRLVLMPSLFETWGNVVPEALASGVPIVASTDVPAGELINDSLMGNFFQRDVEHDETALLQAIESALEVPVDETAMLYRHKSVEEFMQENCDLTGWLCRFQPGR